LKFSNDPISLKKFVQAMCDNPIVAYQADDHERDIIVRQHLWKSFAIINEPQAIKHVMIDNGKNYVRTELGRRILEPFIGEGLLSSEGEVWRQHRQVIAPSCDVRSAIRYTPMMGQVAADLVKDWQGMGKQPTVDIYEALREATLEVICQVMFSCGSKEIVSTIKKGFSHARLVGRPSFLDLLNMPIWLTRLVRPGRGKGKVEEFEEVVRYLRGVRQGEISKGRDFNDYLASMLSARDGAQNGIRMSDLDVDNEIATILNAGHHTTALSMTWSWYLLSQYPDAQVKLQEEVDTVLGGRAPQYEDLANLKYTRMVMEEAMRLIPPVPTLPRRAVADDEVMGTRIKAGMTVFVAPWLLHRKKSIWKDPESYRPERFAPEEAKARHRFSYMPFGGGPHICIGSTIAMTEAMMFTATIAQKYHMSLVPNHNVEILGLFNVVPRNGMKMVLTPRN
jgi:cytochrome P450